MKVLHIIAWILVIVGALNWGLIGIGSFVTGIAGSWNVVNLLLGSWSQVEWIVYVLVGLSALWVLIKHRSECKACSAM